MKARAGRAIEVTQRVVGTPEEVFPYFTNAEMYVKWKGLEAQLDPRPGGIYRVKMWDGGLWAEGEYLEVEPPSRVVFSWGWRGELVPAGMAEVPPGSTRVEIDLIADGDGTIIRLRHSGLPGDDAEVVHTWGWQTFLSRLEVRRAGGDPGEHPQTVPTPADLRGVSSR
ncbi:MAG: SRPBCC family protein [Acidimicrobiia bacterium]